MIEKGSDATVVRIVGGRWDGATGRVLTRTGETAVVRMDDGTEVEIEVAGYHETGQATPRELGS